MSCLSPWHRPTYLLHEIDMINTDAHAIFCLFFQFHFSMIIFYSWCIKTRVYQTITLYYLSKLRLVPRWMWQAVDRWSFHKHRQSLCRPLSSGSSRRWALKQERCFLLRCIKSGFYLDGNTSELSPTFFSCLLRPCPQQWLSVEIMDWFWKGNRTTVYKLITCTLPHT